MRFFREIIKPIQNYRTWWKSASVKEWRFFLLCYFSHINQSFNKERTRMKKISPYTVKNRKVSNLWIKILFSSDSKRLWADSFDSKINNFHCNYNVHNPLFLLLYLINNNIRACVICSLYWILHENYFEKINKLCWKKLSQIIICCNLFQMSK